MRCRPSVVPLVVGAASLCDHARVLVVIGEALVDLVVDDDGGIVAALGGGPFNAARAAARLGAEVAYAGALSTDHFGGELRARLLADGVDCSRTSTTALPTTLALARTDTSGAAEYSFYLVATSAPAYDPATLDLAGCSLVVTGGLALAVEPLAGRVADLLGRLSAAPATLVDLNCRPAVVTDRAGYTARLRAIAAGATIVKASAEDLEFIAPGEPPEVTARGLLADGCRAVLLTCGTEPTTVLTAAAEARIPIAAPAAPVIDTIGAGDTFCGAVAAELYADGTTAGDLAGQAGFEHLAAAVDRAHRAAAIVVTRRGADPPWAHELDQTR
jgi:fructokinase